MLSMVAIAAVCVCVALLFKSSPEVLFVFRPFRWELLDYGSSWVEKNANLIGVWLVCVLNCKVELSVELVLWSGKIINLFMFFLESLMVWVRTPPSSWCVLIGIDVMNGSALDFWHVTVNHPLKWPRKCFLHPSAWSHVAFFEILMSVQGYLCLRKWSTL